jgi:glycosyltransferase involved in cell wall biosynthesis
MNILEVVEAWDAGVGRHVRSLCAGLVAEGHQVTVAYSPYRAGVASRQFMRDRRNEIRFIPLKVRREISVVSDLRAVIRLLRLIESEGPFHLVHGHSSKGGALARIAGRWRGIPTVYTPHSLLMASPELSRAKAAIYTSIERILGHWATSGIIAVSEGEYEYILNLKLVPSTRLARVQNSLDDIDFDIDFEHFSETTTHHKEDIRQKPLTFGSTMRFSAQKAPSLLIEAFTQLSAALPQYSTRLMVAGDGELFGEAKRQIKASGLGEKISLLGWRSDTKEVLRELDVFVLPSLYEGLSYAVLEAMAAKLPIVATDVFGTKETISQVPGNIVVPVGDPTVLADGMKQMITLAKPESIRLLLQEIGHANHDYARRHFRQSENTRRTLQVYENCLMQKIGAHGQGRI